MHLKTKGFKCYQGKPRGRSSGRLCSCMCLLCIENQPKNESITLELCLQGATTAYLGAGRGRGQPWHMLAPYHAMPCHPIPQTHHHICSFSRGKTRCRKTYDLPRDILWLAGKVGSKARGPQHILPSSHHPPCSPHGLSNPFCTLLCLFSSVVFISRITGSYF